MKKISRDYDELPEWLECSKSLVPDFVAKDVKTSPVWEISGVHFSIVAQKNAKRKMHF